MAGTKTLASRNRTSEDDIHDQIGSNSSTPPGAATPRPDLKDKRLPSIIHSFGQVCASFCTSPKPASSLSKSSISTTQSESMGSNGHRQKQQASDGLPTAPNSPRDAEDRAQNVPPLPSHERLNLPLPLYAPKLELSTIPYPTPPVSSSSSIHRASKGESSGFSLSSERPCAARALSSQDEKNPVQILQQRERRHTFASPSPLLNIVAVPPVPAAFISNPASDPSSVNPAHSIIAQLSASRRQSRSLSRRGSRKLTKGGSLPPGTQSTPPDTPRTRSQDGTVSRNSSAYTSLAALRTITPAPATSGPVLGKLTVEISEGRGFRPSYDPYIVCQFQWSEYISQGPINADLEHRQNANLRQPNGLGGVAMRRTDSGSRPRAIPMTSRQSSHTGRDATEDRSTGHEVTDPKWEHKTVFDVVGTHAEIDVSVYDRLTPEKNQEKFLGHIRFCPALVEYDAPFDGWFTLEPREGESDEGISGEIHLRISFQKTEKKHYGPEDFEILKLIGKGTFGQVFQVRKKDTRRVYAMKVLSKKVIIQKKEVAHTLGERNILVRTAKTDSPFIVGLKFSFQTASDLYLVTDYMSGGELFWHLQKEGRFNELRAKFYIAELILALQHLHDHNIVYRDLKPENILLDANGHIALCDFGLSKANLSDSDTTNTFCGTTEYLAPEVLLDENGYTKMVDFWSLGVLVFEMCCGWSPFYAEDTQQMYKNIAFGKVRFPRDALSTEGRNFVKGLLNRNPKHRLGANGDAEELKAHPFFADVDWEALSKKNVVPPFKPKLKSELDVSNFDPEFTNALSAGTGSLNARAAALASGVNPASTPLSPTVQANFKGFTFVDESTMKQQFRDREDLDRMDEDDQDDDEEWEKISNRGKGDRMSGVMHTSTHDTDDEVFNSGFDV